MSRRYAVLTAFILGTYRWRFPVWHWSRPSDWPVLLLGGAFVREPECVR